MEEQCKILKNNFSYKKIGCSRLWQFQIGIFILVSFPAKALFVSFSDRLKQGWPKCGPWTFFGTWKKHCKNQIIAKNFQNMFDFSLNKHQKWSQKGKNSLKFFLLRRIFKSWDSHRWENLQIWPERKKVWPPLVLNKTVFLNTFFYSLEC